MTEALPTFNTIREELAAWTKSHLGEPALVHAKSAFMRDHGAVFPEDPFFDERMNYFLNSFLFELRGVEGTPYEQRVRLSAFPDIDAYRHSLFLVLTTDLRALRLRDLVTGTEHDITSDGEDIFAGISRGDCFQGFLIFRKNQILLARGLIFHPKTVLGILRSHLERALKSPLFDEKSCLSRLARQQVRHLRHPHVPASRIYGEDPP